MAKIIVPTEQERMKIAALKAGMQEMLDAFKKGLRFRIVTEEVQPPCLETDVSYD